MLQKLCNDEWRAPTKSRNNFTLPDKKVQIGAVWATESKSLKLDLRWVRLEFACRSVLPTLANHLERPQYYQYRLTGRQWAP